MAEVAAAHHLARCYHWQEEVVVATQAAVLVAQEDLAEAQEEIRLQTWGVRVVARYLVLQPKRDTPLAQMVLDMVLAARAVL